MGILLGGYVEIFPYQADPNLPSFLFLILLHATQSSVGKTAQFL
jgi:hypothetical protein